MRISMNDAIGSVSTSVSTLSSLQQLAGILSQYADALANVLGDVGVAEQLQEYSVGIYGSGAGSTILVDQIVAMFKRCELLLREGLKKPRTAKMIEIAYDFQDSLHDIKKYNHYIAKEFGRKIDELFHLIKKVIS